MCTADGRNYLAHLTSEIFFFLFLLSLPFPQITPRLGKLIDSLCTLAFDLYMEGFFFFGNPILISIQLALWLWNTLACLQTNTKMLGKRLKAKSLLYTRETRFSLRRSSICFPGNVWPHADHTCNVETSSGVKHVSQLHRNIHMWPYSVEEKQRGSRW